jgi:hypothetical protein
MSTELNALDHGDLLLSAAVRMGGTADRADQPERRTDPARYALGVTIAFPSLKVELQAVASCDLA